LKVLLTGASGFVGGHVLESLQQNSFPTAVLLRDPSKTESLKNRFPATEIRQGSVEHPSSLSTALEGITHVIHCAGRTKAVRVSEYYQTNQLGTRNLLEVVNRSGQVQRFVHISSLAVTGPATAEQPAQEDQPALPVSDYGKSKLAAEIEVRDHCRAEFTIIRPPAVYGPRDTGFLSMFKAIQRHILPRPGTAQCLSIVYAKDLAEGIVKCLTEPVAVGKTYFVASPEIITARKMAEEIAGLMNTWTLPLPLPAPLLYAVCLWQQLLSQVTNRASLLNLQKYAELSAPGWVCSSAKLLAETGYACSTRLGEGLRQTLDWYRREHWV
jgi:nucleoside-diphosphate-sugar epimerase